MFSDEYTHPLHRGSGGGMHEGLSYAKRRPKLFTKPERPVWGVQRQQADVRSWGLPTAAVDPKRR